MRSSHCRTLKVCIIPSFLAVAKNATKREENKCFFGIIRLTFHPCKQIRKNNITPSWPICYTSPSWFGAMFCMRWYWDSRHKNQLPHPNNPTISLLPLTAQENTDISFLGAFGKVFYLLPIFTLEKSLWHLDGEYPSFWTLVYYFSSESKTNMSTYVNYWLFPILACLYFLLFVVCRKMSQPFTCILAFALQPDVGNCQCNSSWADLVWLVNGLVLIWHMQSPLSENLPTILGGKIPRICGSVCNKTDGKVQEW